MKLQKYTALALFQLGLAIAPTQVLANDHLTPDITDFSNPYVAFRSAYSAQIVALKGQKSAGDKEQSLRTQMNQVVVGFKKERVDNRYSIIGFGYATSKNGELDYTDSEIIVQNHYQFKYGEGRHVGQSGKIDWNIFIAIEAGDYQLGFETKSELGLGLGGEMMYSVTSFLDLGAQLNVSTQIQSLALGIDINF
jgi:hypothetical protein